MWQYAALANFHLTEGALREVDLAWGITTPCADKDPAPYSLLSTPTGIFVPCRLYPTDSFRTACGGDCLVYDDLPDTD